ncbi:hypothetical protein EON65_57795, partial [archaeon]
MLVTTDYIGGSLYCGSFHGPSDDPKSLVTSSAAIIAQGNTALVVSNPTRVTVLHLEPLASYYVFCTTTSSMGNFLSLAASTEIYVSASTECCKQIFLSWSTTTLVSDTASINAIEGKLNFAPREMVTVTLQAEVHNSSQTSVREPILVPNSFIFTNTSSSLAFSATVMARDVGTFAFNVSLFGASAGEYTLIYPSSRLFIVISSNVEPLTPSLLEARFASDGRYVELSFSSATNRAGYTGVFPCDRLLAFVMNQTAICRFTSASSIRISQSPLAALYNLDGSAISFLFVGTPITLLNSASPLTAACDGGRSIQACSQWARVPLVTVFVQPPLYVNPPFVVISSPDLVSSCQALTLDLTASSGSGGRAWRNVSVRVRRVGEIAVEGLLNAYMNSPQYTLSP